MPNPNFDTTIEGFIPGVKVVNALNCNVPVVFTNTVTFSGTGASTFSGAISFTGNETFSGSNTHSGSELFGSGQALTNGGGAAVITIGSVSGLFGIYFGSGAPTIVAGQGSIYVNTIASTSITRVYVNTTGASAWAYLQASA